MTSIRGNSRPRVPGAVAVLVAVLLGATACGGRPAAATDVVSEVDRTRAAVLSADPVLAGANPAPTVIPGRVHSDRLGWDRTEVSGRLFLRKTATGEPDLSAADVEGQVAAVMKTMRTGGWSVHWTLCLAPPAPGTTMAPGPAEAAATPSQSPTTPTANPGPPGDVPLYNAREWVFFAYKIENGVSYWAMVTGALVAGTGAFVDILLRAPNARDPANLLDPAPRALPAGSTCAEDGRPATDPEQAGTPVAMRDWIAFPGQSHSPDPYRR